MDEKYKKLVNWQLINENYTIIWNIICEKVPYGVTTIIDTYQTPCVVPLVSCEGQSTIFITNEHL